MKRTFTFLGSVVIVILLASCDFIGLFDGKQDPADPSSESQEYGTFIADEGFPYTEIPDSGTPIAVTGSLSKFLENSYGIYGPVGMMPIQNELQRNCLPACFTKEHVAEFTSWVLDRAQASGCSIGELKSLGAAALLELANRIVCDALLYHGSATTDLYGIAQDGFGVCTQYAGLFVGVYNELKSHNENTANLYAHVFNSEHHVFVHLTYLHVENGALHVAVSFVDPNAADENAEAFDAWEPDRVNVRYSEADLDQMIGRDPDASSFREKAIDLYGEYLDGSAFSEYYANLSLAGLHIQQGAYESAEQYIAKAFQAQQSHGWVSALLTLAISADVSGLQDLAIEIAQYAESNIPLDPPLIAYQVFETYALEARIQNERGNGERARACCQFIVANWNAFGTDTTDYLFTEAETCLGLQTGTDLLGDSDMEEEGLSPWDGWAGTADCVAERSAGVFHSPSASLKLTSTVSSTANLGSWSQTIPENIPHGEVLTLKAYIKTENLTGTGASIAVAGFSGATQVFFASTEQFLTISGTKDWTEYSLGTPAIPLNVDHLRVMLVLCGNTCGTVYFDDVSLIQYSPATD